MAIVFLFGLLFLLLIGLTIWLIAYLMRKNEWGQKVMENNDNFHKYLRLIYMYGVMLVMLFAFVTFAIEAINSLGYVFFPDDNVSYAVSPYKTLVPALVGVFVTAPVFIYHFRGTGVKKDKI